MSGGLTQAFRLEKKAWSFHSCLKAADSTPPADKLRIEKAAATKTLSNQIVASSASFSDATSGVDSIGKAPGKNAQDLHKSGRAGAVTKCTVCMSQAKKKKIARWAMSKCYQGVKL